MSKCNEKTLDKYGELVSLLREGSAYLHINEVEEKVLKLRKKHPRIDRLYKDRQSKYNKSK